MKVLLVLLLINRFSIHSSILQYLIHIHTDKHRLSHPVLPGRVVAFCEWLLRFHHGPAVGPAPLVGSSLLYVNTHQLHPEDVANHYPAVDANPKAADKKNNCMNLYVVIFL